VIGRWVKETTIVEYPAGEPVTFFGKDGRPLITIQIGPSKSVTTTLRRRDTLATLEQE
jgi:hypothetical protein